MLSIWPTTSIRLPGAELFLVLGDDFADVVGDAAEIAALGVAVDLIDRLDIGLIGVGRNSNHA